MPIKLPRWLRHRSQSTKAGHQNGPGQIQMLGSERLNLTPTASRESLIARAKASTAVASSILFVRLPPEVRWQILVHAFGGSDDRPVHMDLVLGKANAWLWRGCRCYRHTPSEETFEDYSPAVDRCLERNACSDDCCRGSHGLGITGWLCSCRQA